MTPTTQIQVTSNGIRLLKGDITFNDLFQAGAHSVYVDMYRPQPETTQKLIAMAEQVRGVQWYKYLKGNSLASHPKHRMANTYYGAPEDMRLVILQDNPEYRLRWRKEGRLSSFLNNIDWKVAIPYGLVPVRETYKRMCTLPMRYVSIDNKGNYLFCCIDFKCESAGLLGNFKDGPEAFRHFWHGRLMQSIRRRLAVGDRAGIPYCSRCNCAFSKCDWTHIWSDYENHWDGEKMIPLPPQERDDEVFADGWAKARAVQASLPSVEEEQAILAESRRRIIMSTAATRKKAPQPEAVESECACGVLGQITYYFSPEQNTELFKRVRNSLVQTGVLVIDVPLLLDALDEGSSFGAFFLWATSGGKPYSFAEYSEWLETAGFKGVRQLGPEWLSAHRS